MLLPNVQHTGNINDNSQASYDKLLGHAALDAANIEELTGLVLTAGEHTLKFQLSGKNASSSSYRFRTSGVWLQRTA